MNRETIDLILLITTMLSVFAIVLLARWLVINLEDRFNKRGWLHEKFQEIMSGIKTGLILIFGIWFLISVGYVSVEKFMTFETARQQARKQRLDFLVANCERIDQGYEILNGGKPTYKCPNGKEYKE